MKRREKQCKAREVNKTKNIEAGQEYRHSQDVQRMK